MTSASFLPTAICTVLKETPTGCWSGLWSVKADICCFGHTHTPLSLYRDGVYLLNPGSLSQPRVGFPSYAVIDLTQAGVAIHHTTLR
ncbi:MAG: metallophosphoesterase family protein [Oscillospiraceae bacterium]